MTLKALGVGNGIIGSGVGGAGNGFVQPENWLVVNKLSDLPAPSGGEIQLPPNVNVILGANITVEDDIIINGSCRWTSSSFFAPMITRLNGGTLFSGVDAQFFLDNANVDAPSSEIYNFEDVAAPNTSIINSNLFTIVRCASLGDFTNTLTVQFENGAILQATQGITLNGAFGIFSIDKIATVTANAAFIGVDFGTAVIATLSVNKYVAIGVAGSIALKGAAANANLAAGDVANITDCDLNQGGGTSLSTITRNDIRWNFRNNKGVTDNGPWATSELTTPTTVTISIAGTFVAINSGNWTAGASNLMFGHTIDGLLTYLPEFDTTFTIGLSATVVKNGGGSDLIATRVAINGTTVVSSNAQTESTRESGVSGFMQITLTTGDTVQAFVTNMDTTSSVDVADATLHLTQTT